MERTDPRRSRGRGWDTMGYRKLSDRPRHHAQAATEDFKKTRRRPRPACGGRNGVDILTVGEERPRRISGGGDPVKKRGPWAVAHLRGVTPSRRSRSGS